MIHYLDLPREFFLALQFAIIFVAITTAYVFGHRAGLEDAKATHKAGLAKATSESHATKDSQGF